MDSRPIRLLLVEDNPGDALLVREALAEDGSGRFELAHVDRLAAGLEAVRGGGVDVVLLDLSLPDSSGLATFCALHEAAPHLPIVVLSGLNDETTAVAVVAEGAQGYLVKGLASPGLLARALLCAIHRERQEVELARSNEQRAELAATDALTGLRNARHLRGALPAAFSLAGRTGQPLSLVMLDVDHFKSYNDSFGHSAGDEVLRQVGAILRRMTRAHDLGARYGGEEFAVLLPATDARAAKAFAERLRAIIAGHPWPLRPVTASLGVATSRAGVPDGDALLAEADRALDRAKRAGRDRVVHHDDPPGPSEAASTRLVADAVAARPGHDLPKSAEPDEFLAVIGALVRARRAEREQQRACVEIDRICDATIEGWARALELRDHESEGHGRRVVDLTVRLARRMGLDEPELVHVRRGALLHDIGKIGIPDAILSKPGPLNNAEWQVMRRHPEMGYKMLQPIPFLWPTLEILYCHHERWDGSGYPRGLQREQIPLAARLLAVVDVWDALGHDRPYRAGWPEDRVREHLRSLAGTHLDPQAVAEFLAVASD